MKLESKDFVIWNRRMEPPSMESRKVLERDLQGSSQHLSRGVKWEVMYLHPELSEISALAIQMVLKTR